MKFAQRILVSIAIMIGIILLIYVPTSAVFGEDSEPTLMSGDLTVHVSEAVTPAISKPVRDIPSRKPEAILNREINPIRNPGLFQEDLGLTGSNTKSQDPLVELSRMSTGRTPDPIFTFEGLGTDGYTPPDTMGEVGPNHYVQMVNVSFAIYDKSGNVLVEDTLFTDLFAGSGLSSCSSQNDGDPVVLWDSMADRWLLSQFAVSTSPEHMCIAISQTSDPTGAYYLYEFEVPDFPDYFKFGVWPDAYYMGTNTGYPNQYYAYAFDRDAMLAGDPATYQYSNGHPNFLLPADLDGPTEPAANTPGHFYTMLAEGYANHPPGVDRIVLYEFDVDWDTPANSTFGIAQEIPIADYNYTTCGFFAGDCIPQPDTTQKLDAVDPWPMWRFVYRNLGSYEALVGNFTVDTNGSDHAGIRWFELQDSGSGWSLYQEGTHAPDDTHRWMGSIAIDGSGNIALGYSASSDTVYPSLRYASRLASDPLGTLQAEAILYPGGGSQTGPYDRWGDYSSLSVDPTDECTFWYTGEYHDVTDVSFNWNTRIGTFRLPECTGSLGPDFGISADPSALDICAPDDAVYDLSVNFMSGFDGEVTFSTANLPPNATATFVPTSVVTPTTDSVLTIGTTGVAFGSYDVDIVGVHVPTPTHTTTVGLDVYTLTPSAPTLTMPSDGETDVSLIPTFSWDAVDQTQNYTLEVAEDAAFTTVVYTATVDGTSHSMVGGNLDPEGTYYWRVKADNICGESAYSPVYSFTTVLVFCSYPEAPIDSYTTVTDTLSTTRSDVISDLNVEVNLSHTFIGDLDISLTHQESGASVILLPTSFSCSADDIDATFDDEASDPISCGSTAPALSGYVIPDEALAAFDFDSINGSWELAVTDSVGGDSGTLHEWCLVPSFTDSIGTAAGEVTDANTSLGIASAVITLDDGSSAYTAITDNSGLYTRTVPGGTYTVTAVAEGYVTGQATGVVVVNQNTTTQDFVLAAGLLEASDDSLAETVELGDLVTNTLTLTNVGTADLEFNISRVDNGYSSGVLAPTDGEDVLLVDGGNSTATAAFALALDTLGYTYVETTDEDYVLMTVDDLLTYSAVVYAFYPNNTAEFDLTEDYLDAGGSFLVSDNDFGWSQGSSDLYTVYLQANYVSDAGSDGIITGMDIMDGITADISADPYPDDFTANPEGVGIFEAPSGNLAGIRVERMGYRAIYLAWDFHSTGSSSAGDPEEAEILDAALNWLIVSDEFWLSTDIVTGTLASTASQEVTVIMDAAQVALAGEYYGDIIVSNDSPYGDLVIPVTMSVTCSTCGTIMGDVTDAYTSLPLTATVQITSTAGFEYIFEDTTSYYLSVPADTYYLTAFATDYLTETATVSISTGVTTTQDFALTPAYAELIYAPADIEEYMEVGDVVTNTVTVTNTGTIDLDFNVHIGGWGGPDVLSVQQVESSHTPVHIPADEGKFERGTAAPSIERAPIAVNGHVETQQSFNQPLGTVSYATDAGLSQFVSVDLDVPGSPTNIASFANAIWAGDMANDMLYAIDDTTTNLVTIDMVTGVPTTIGATGDSNTTGMAYDPETGNMYVSDVTACGTSSQLHTIDLNTGALTLIGTVTNSPCLIGIATDDTGQLYGYDIVDDTLLSIDKTTGAGTVIGSIGYDANFAQGMAFDVASGQMYLAAFNNSTSQAELRIADLVTGNTALVGVLGTSGTSQYGWLAIPGLSGSGDWASTPFTGATVTPGETTTFEVVFDATTVFVEGDYTAELTYSGNFINDVPTMPLTMHLTCPTCGAIMGDITDAYTSLPLPATVQITSTAGIDHSIDDTTSYSLPLPADTYYLTVVATGYLTETATVAISTGVTTTQDFALTPAYAELIYAPADIEEYMEVGDIVTNTVTVTNTGTIPLVFDTSVGNFDGPGSVLSIQKVESSLTVDNQAVVSTIPVITSSEECAAYENYAGREPIGAATYCKVSQIEPDPQTFEAGLLAPTDIGYAQDIGYISDNFVSFTLNDFPGQSVVGTNSAAYYGMDFDQAGTTLYALNDDTGELGTIDLATGAFTGLVSAPAPVDIWTGLSIDPTDGTFYASDSEGLYTINPTTGATTLIGSFSTATIMIDISVSPTGQMYGHDMGTDAIYMIDKATGADTLVGATGYDASYAQGMDFDNEDGTLYIFLYIGSGANVYGTVDLATGSVTPLATDNPLGEFEGAIPNPGSSALTDWVEVVDGSGTVIPGETATFEVVFDATDLYLEGDYTAELTYSGNFINDVPTMPLTMHLTCPMCGVLDGTIMDGMTSLPMTATVRITSTNGYDNSMGGSYYTASMLPGDYYFTVSASGYQTETAVVTAVPGTTVTTDFTMMPFEGSLNGSITDAVTSLPMTATVRITDTNGYDFTVVGTSYDVSVLPGDYYLTVSADGYLTETAMVTAVSESTVTTDFALTERFKIYIPITMKQ